MTGTGTEAGSLRQYRAFCLVFGGQAISQLGNSAFRVALVVAALQLDPQGGLLPRVLLVQGIALLVSVLFGGALVDRMSAKKVLLYCDLLRALVVTLLGVLFATGSVRPLHLLVLGLAFGLVDGVFQPAMRAAIVELLPADLIAQGNAVKVSVWRSISLVGGLIGGLVGILGIATGFLVNAATFGVAAVALIAGGRWPRAFAAKAGRKDSLLHSTRQGAAFVFSTPWLKGLILLSCLAVALIYAGSFSLLPQILSQRPNGTYVYGLVLSMTSAGGLLAGLLMARRKSVRRQGLIFLGTVAGAALCYLGMILLTQLVLIAVLALVAGLLTSVNGIVYMSVLQVRVPRDLLGRVSALDTFGSYALIPVAQAVLGFTAPLAGPELVYGVCLAASLIVFAVACLYRPVAGLRSIDVSEDRTPNDEVSSDQGKAR